MSGYTCWVLLNRQNIQFQKLKILLTHLMRGDTNFLTDL
jgi:hypothetical protein